MRSVVLLSQVPQLTVLFTEGRGTWLGLVKLISVYGELDKGKLEEIQLKSDCESPNFCHYFRSTKQQMNIAWFRQSEVKQEQAVSDGQMLKIRETSGNPLCLLEAFFSLSEANKTIISSNMNGKQNAMSGITRASGTFYPL